MPASVRLTRRVVRLNSAPEMRFEFADVLADRRRRQAERLRGVGEKI
jgi:hypothetical protein